MNRSRLAGLALIAFAASCSSSESPDRASSATSTGALPCDVDAVLTRACRKCHATPPKFGAPMPLDTWGDLHAAARSDATQKVHQRVKARIHDPVSPMPQGDTLAASELATLDRWLDAGAPPRSNGETCAAADAGPAARVGPEHLPCPAAEQTTFRAHAAGAPDAPFAVPADSGNLYQCFTWKVPWTSETQATAFAPIIDDGRVVHHWILYSTATPQEEGGAGPCKMPFDATFLSGWAPGGGNRDMPPDVGLALPGAEPRWLIFQLHYWNVAGYTDARDRSGVAMCTASGPTLRKHTAVVSTLGSLAIDLPPKSARVEVSGMCTPDTQQDLHVISAGPHMHELGASFKTEILRGGDPSKSEVLVDVPRWDFQSQALYPTDKIVRPGDKLRTTCTYANSTGQRVTFGERTEDEMCFNFVAVWPAPGLVNAGGKGALRCIDR